MLRRISRQRVWRDISFWVGHAVSLPTALGVGDIGGRERLLLKKDGNRAEYRAQMKKGKMTYVEYQHLFTYLEKQKRNNSK